MKEFNGYAFDEPKIRKRMKYLVIRDGDLDINNAYSYKSKRDLEKDLKETYRELLAVFEIQDITSEYL